MVASSRRQRARGPASPQPRPGRQGRASFPAAFHLGAILPRGPPPRDSRPPRGPHKRNVQAAGRPFLPASQPRRRGGLLTSAGVSNPQSEETTELEVSTELTATRPASLYVIIGSPALPRSLRGNAVRDYFPRLFLSLQRKRLTRTSKVTSWRVRV